MRIGIYLGDFTPEAGGGFTFQDEVFRAFASTIQGYGHEYVVIGTSNDLNDYVASTGACIEIHQIRIGAVEKLKESLKVFSPLLGRFLGSGAIEKACATLGLDFVWYVGGGAYEVLDTPYVATVWDLQHRMTPWFPEMSSVGVWDARELAYRRFLQRASYVVTGTAVGRQELELNYGVAASRIRCLPHPTPNFVQAVTDSESDGIIDRLGLEEQSYLFYPAQFWAHKNHIGLLIALKYLRDQYQVVMPLVLTGSDKGNVSYIKETIKRLGLSDQVVFTGFITQQELTVLYRGASMMVYASFCGPENLPPLEAFALGCPVVAANVPGAFEQLGDAALLFDPLSPEDMAAKIYMLLKNFEQRTGLREKAFNRASSWTVGDFTAAMIQIFNEFSQYRQSWPPARNKRKE